MKNLWAEAFGDTVDFIQLFFDTGYSPDRCLVALFEGKVVGALYWFDCEYQEKKLAYLYAVATAKTCRGMGICHNLIAACHSHLAASGYAGVLLVPGNEDLFSFYRNLGYEICSYVREFECIAEKGELFLHSITKEQYAKLRRKFLPANGVIQEEENLAFLQTYAQFFVGCNCEDVSPQSFLLEEPIENFVPDRNNDYCDFFLLAAYREGTTLHGIELLGNPSDASHIVHELGCIKGNFRTPRTSHTSGISSISESLPTQESKFPFAMYHPLDDVPVDLPVHFGFAFD